MNVYGPWWDKTITIYNKFTDPENGEVYWYRHVVQDTYYSHETNQISVGQTVISSDRSICRIRVDERFRDKRIWNELSASDKEKYFTLAPGDIIVAEEVTDSISEYSKGNRSSDIAKKYKDWPGCFSVDTVKINVGGGRGNEHYLARGV